MTPAVDVGRLGLAERLRTATKAALERLHLAEDNATLLSLGVAKMSRHIAEKLPYVCATLSPGNRTALTNGMCGIDANGAEQSRVFVEYILDLMKAVASEVMKGSGKNET